MLLVLRRETERGTQRDGEETNKRGIYNLEQIHFKPFKSIKEPVSNIAFIVFKIISVPVDFSQALVFYAQ